MTRKQLRKNYSILRKKTNQMLHDYLEAALKSGAVGDLREEEYEYRLPKNIMCAALRNAEWQWKPIRTSDKKEINNIYSMTPSV